MNAARVWSRDLLDVSCVAAPKILGGVAQLIFNVILLRFLVPSEYGTFAICLTGILLFDAVLGSAVDMGLLRLVPSYASAGRPEDALRIQQAGLIMKVMGAVVLVIAVLPTGAALSLMLFQRADRAGAILISLCALLGLLVLRSIQTHYQVTGKFGLYGFADLLHNLFRFGGIAVCLAAGYTEVPTLLGLYAIAPMAISVVLLLTSARGLISVSPTISAFKKLSSVICWYLPTAAVGSLISRIDLLMVSRFAGVGEAGVMSAAYALVIAPQLMGTYIAVVFGPVIVPKLENRTLAGFFWRIQIGLAGVSAILFVIALLSLDALAPLLLPQSYQTSTRLVLILLPSTLAALINFPLTVQTLLFARPRTLLIFDLVSLLPLVVAYQYAIVRFGAEGAAIVTTAFALLKTVFFHGTAWVVLKRGQTDIADSSIPALEVC